MVSLRGHKCHGNCVQVVSFFMSQPRISTMGMLRFPSVALFIIVFLHQGFAVGVTMTVLYSTHKWWIGVGALVAILYSGGLGVSFYSILGKKHFASRFDRVSCDRIARNWMRFHGILDALRTSSVPSLCIQLWLFSFLPYSVVAGKNGEQSESNES
eukprot:gene22720-biopygen8186